MEKNLGCGSRMKEDCGDCVSLRVFGMLVQSPMLLYWSSPPFAVFHDCDIFSRIKACCRGRKAHLVLFNFQS